MNPKDTNAIDLMVWRVMPFFFGDVAKRDRLLVEVGEGGVAEEVSGHDEDDVEVVAVAGDVDGSFGDAGLLAEP